MIISLTVDNVESDTDSANAVLFFSLFKLLWGN